MKRNRLVLYPKDVQLITGRGLRYAQRILRIIRKKYGKTQDQFVTVEEFCEVSGLTPRQIEAYLR
jgi:hypothetical protein